MSFIDPQRFITSFITRRVIYETQGTQKFNIKKIVPHFTVAMQSIIWRKNLFFFCWGLNANKINLVSVDFSTPPPPQGGAVISQLISHCRAGRQRTNRQIYWDTVVAVLHGIHDVASRSKCFIDNERQIIWFIPFDICRLKHKVHLSMTRFRMPYLLIFPDPWSSKAKVLTSQSLPSDNIMGTYLEISSFTPSMSKHSFHFIGLVQWALCLNCVSCF